MNKIFLSVSVVEKNLLEFDCEISGDWGKYFTGDRFWAKYEQDISNVPESILVIPIFGSILQLSWIFDGEIICNELDEDFYNAIQHIKNGYMNMYPNLELKGSVKPKNIIKNNVKGENVVSLFSGGVDAFSTLINHIEENPMLCTIWGADVSIDNESAWDKVDKHRKSVIDEWGLEGTVIKSSLRKFVVEKLLHSWTLKNAGDGWWHGFHHSIGMLCLLAPMSYTLGVGRIYIASSYSAKDRKKVKCASDPTIDNKVRFCGCQVVHDGYELNRQDKIENICKYSDISSKKFQLRVCWLAKDGDNCCKCEKCFRTILGIYAENRNPHDFGFLYDNKMLEGMSTGGKKGRGNIFGEWKDLYKEMSKRLRKNCDENEVPKELKWIYKNYMWPYEIRYCIYNFLRKIKRMILKRKK